MNLPIKVFNIKGKEYGYIKMEIVKTYGFPESLSFRGGYDIKCRLEISSGVYTAKTDTYFTTTGALFSFYRSLSSCYEISQGIGSYSLYCPESILLFEIKYEDNGMAVVSGTYKNDPQVPNTLKFEFKATQADLEQVVFDLRHIVSIFGDMQGKKIF